MTTEAEALTTLAFVSLALVNSALVGSHSSAISNLASSGRSSLSRGLANQSGPVSVLSSVCNDFGTSTTAPHPSLTKWLNGLYSLFNSSYHPLTPEHLSYLNTIMGDHQLPIPSINDQVSTAVNNPISSSSTTPSSSPTTVPATPLGNKKKAPILSTPEPPALASSTSVPSVSNVFTYPVTLISSTLTATAAASNPRLPHNLTLTEAAYISFQNAVALYSVKGVGLSILQDSLECLSTLINVRSTSLLSLCFLYTASIPPFSARSPFPAPLLFHPTCLALSYLHFRPSLTLLLLPRLAYLFSPIL